ncbi:MAG: septum formation initiator family protein [Alphaproteobacteria bacterium]|nr:septum formation initiator family protein [Alphaproteobacteria bacterium]NCQ66595.1 septum formation initiator family protein [Alphaproteobacteria bacterium]NCT06947.1 septum formation initiator family protein [Alphaproteobacteria bacterium]
MIIRDLRRRARRYTVQSIILCLVLYFLYHLIQGGRGIMTLRSLEDSLDKASVELSVIKEKHDKLEHRVNLMKPGSICPDLLEEQAKNVLGYARQNEKIVLSEKSSN